MQKNARSIVVAMSGGVDSSVVAAMLKERGERVIGVMLRLWSEAEGEEGENRCCTLDALSKARQIAGKLDIPFYALDAKEIFYDVVVKDFINGYTQGLTPNPCLICNRHIRWDFMFKRARALGGEYLATGHYARLQKTNAGEVQLRKGIDPRKDQSYVLHGLNQNVLQRTLFPLGEYTKDNVRAMARDFDLPVADRPDSQDLCFVGAGDYRQFLRRHAPQAKNPGPILSTKGEKIGTHAGLAFYTIGQRKGLGVFAPKPVYVMAKDVAKNALIVGEREDLGRDQFWAQEINWISGTAPTKPFRAEVKIRYRARPVWCRVTPEKNHQVYIKLEESLRDITPGQAAVFYDGEICLGGGTII